MIYISFLLGEEGSSSRDEEDYGKDFSGDSGECEFSRYGRGGF